MDFIKANFKELSVVFCMVVVYFNVRSAIKTMSRRMDVLSRRLDTKSNSIGLLQEFFEDALSKNMLNSNRIANHENDKKAHGINENEVWKKETRKKIETLFDRTEPKDRGTGWNCDSSDEEESDETD